MIRFQMKSILAAGCAAIALFATPPLSAQGPNDPNEGSAISYDTTTGVTTFNWWGRAGMGYFIQQSDDLINWQYVPTLELGADSLLSYGFTTTAPDFFVRLQIEANPFGTDTSGAGLFDAYHILSGIAPNSGGLTYMQLWLLNHMPSPNGHPVPLPPGGNSVSDPVYGTPSPGGGGGGPQVDTSHSTNWSTTPPDAHLMVQANDVGQDNLRHLDLDTSAYLQWDLGNARVKGVEIQRRDGGYADWRTVANLDGGLSYHIDSNLVANVDYYYRLVVTYQNGQNFTTSTVEYSVPLIISVSQRRNGKSRNNPGFRDFAGLVPPMFYLEKDTSGDMSVSPVTASYRDYETVDAVTGVVTYSGWSSYSGWGDTDYATESATGSWLGLDTFGDGTTRTIYAPPYTGSVPWYTPSSSTGIDTATEQGWTANYNPGTQSWLIQLSNELTPAQFIATTLAGLPGYGDWTEYLIPLFQDNLVEPPLHVGPSAAGNSPLDILGPETTYALTPWVARRAFDYRTISAFIGQYKFKTNPSAASKVKYYDVFFPDGDPANQGYVTGSHTLNANSSGGDSDSFTIDPSQVPDAWQPTSQTGCYYFTEGARFSAAGFVASDNGPDNLDYSTNLDAQERAQGIAILDPTDPDNSATITMNVENLPGVLYTLTWNSTDFQVIDNNTGEPIYSGKTYSYDDLTYGGRFPAQNWSFTVKAITPQLGEKFTMTLSAVDPNGTSIGDDTIVFSSRVSAPTPVYTMPLQESSGSRYRKIALNGRPMPDEKPHQTAESDEEKEETYVDALSLGLRHSTTDVYVPVPGSDLAISARRDTISEVWNMRSGLRPHERFDRPFGAGWTSNLCPRLEVVTNPATGASTYSIIDQNGASHQFVFVSDGQSGAFIPAPSDRRENGDYLCSFNGNVFTDRYGTNIWFGASGAYAEEDIYADRVGDNSVESHYFFGAQYVQDRLGNTLYYTYPDGVSTLIPNTITLVDAQGNPHPDLTLSIAQDQTGHITDIWDPNGNNVHYQYGTKTYPYDGVVYTETVLTTVTGPDTQATQFTYDFAIEPDLTPPDVTLGEASDKYHIDVQSIQDPSGNTYSFAYEFDHSRFDFSSNDGYYIETGAPRVVKLVGLPGGIGNISFTNDSVVAVVYTDDGNGNLIPSLAPGCHRNVEVQTTDSATNKIISDTTYSFSGGNVLDVLGLYPSAPPQFNPKVVFYTTMQIAYGANGSLGSETYTFDPTAGFALSSVTDLSGNTTSYTYGDSLAAGLKSGFLIAFSQFPGFFGKYSDPTLQTNAAGNAKTFHYSPFFRIMDQVTDENGRFKSYDVDNLGRRRNEQVYTPGPNSTLVQKTEFDYENANFRGVITKTTLDDLVPLGWTTALITQDVLDGNGRVAQHTVDPANLALSTFYSYDHNGNKLSVTDPKTFVTSFGYDTRNRLKEVVYPDGSAKFLCYYPNGNKKQEKDENTHITDYEYDAMNRMTKVTRKMAGGDLVTLYGYNAVGSKISVTDPMQKVTRMKYDGLQRLVCTEDPLTYTTHYHYDGPNFGASAFDSSSFKPTSIVDARGYTTIMTYDSLYRLVSKNQQYDLAQGLWALTQYGYDFVGNRTSVTDARQQTTTTEYDALNRPYHVVFPNTNLTETWTYYTSTGLKWNVVDEEGYSTQTLYDTAGRAVTVMSPQVDDGLNPNDSNRSTHLKPSTVQTSYDKNGNVACVTNPLGKKWDYIYDVRNRKIEEDQPSVTDATTGLPARPTIYTGYDYVGNVIWVQDARGYTTQTGYDEANRPTGTIAPPVFVYGQPSAVQPTTGKTYDFNGNVLTATDMDGNTTVNTYDDMNRLATTTDAQLNEVQYGYDEVGNRTTVKDGNTRVTTFTYDGLNRNTSIQDQHGQATTFTYDGVVKTSQKDALNQMTDYTYDQRNELSSKTYEGLPYPSNYCGYIRDAREDLIGVLEFNQYGLFQLGELGNLDVCTAAGFPDPLHRITQEISCGAYHNYRLDLAGNRLGTLYGLPNGGTGRHLESTYDDLNRLSTVTDVTDAAHPQTTSYGYDLNGNVVTKILPNGEVISMSYDGMNRMFSEKDVSPVLPGGVLYNYVSLCDPAGNLCYSAETTAGVTGRILILGYDLAERLTSESAYDATGNPQVNTTYGYDAANNRTSKTVAPAAGPTVTTTYTINDLNQLTGWSDTSGKSGSYTYDANGNRATRVEGGVSDTYSYDFENRLIQLSRATGGVTSDFSYAYDYRSRRVWRLENSDGSMPVSRWMGVSGDNGTYSCYSGGTSVQEYSDPNSTPDVEYIRGSDWGGGVGGILYSIRNGDPLSQSFAHYDRRGDVTAHTNGEGAITYQASYEAEGTHAIEFGATADRQKANSKEEDPTGLLNEGFRYRDLETDTFITRDPAGFIDGPNLYCYVHQNPWTKFDPEGLASDDPEGVVRKDHHAVPVETLKEQQFSTDVVKELEKLKVPAGKWRDMPQHVFNSAHIKYNERAMEITEQYANLVRSTGVDPSGLSGKAAKEFSEKLVEQINADPFCGKFNKMVGAGAKGEELNALLRASGEILEAKPGLVGKLLKGGGEIMQKVGSKLGPIGEVAMGVFFVKDAFELGPNQAGKNFVKSATFYDVTVEPAGQWYNNVYDQAQHGKLNDDSAIGHNRNELYRMLHTDPVTGEQQP